MPALRAGVARDKRMVTWHIWWAYVHAWLHMMIKGKSTGTYVGNIQKAVMPYCHNFLSFRLHRNTLSCLFWLLQVVISYHRSIMEPVSVGILWRTTDRQVLRVAKFTTIQMYPILMLMQYPYIRSDRRGANKSAEYIYIYNIIINKTEFVNADLVSPLWFCV